MFTVPLRLMWCCEKHDPMVGLLADELAKCFMLKYLSSRYLHRYTKIRF